MGGYKFAILFRRRHKVNVVPGFTYGSGSDGNSIAIGVIME